MSCSRLRRISQLLGAATAMCLVSALSGGFASAAVGSEANRGVNEQIARGYVALGDSYSSGEGTGKYYPETDRPNDMCHRSPTAYGPLLRSENPSLRPMSFVACSGAVTHDLYASNHLYAGEPAQLDALNLRTGSVSLTLGGNDVGFADVANACVESILSVSGQGFRCSKKPALNAALSARIAALAGQSRTPGAAGYPITPMATILADIHAAAPQAKIYLAGYPELFGNQAKYFGFDLSAPSRRSCAVNRPILARVDYADAQWFNANTRKLNGVLQQAVIQARRSGVPATYVPVPAFDGHGLCDARTSWIQPVLIADLAVRSETFHPTPSGQRLGYAAALRQAGL